MTTSHSQAPSTRDERHDALTAFVGRGRAEGNSYRVQGDPGDDPRGVAEAWTSTHTARWHSGEFFLVQDERALTGSEPLDTLSVLGIDAQTGRYFARCYENHGFYRHYDVDVDGAVWTFTGDTERARIEFSADGGTQTITWEWRPKDRWLPLCDRTAIREDQ